MSALAAERESVQKIWDRIDRFMTGHLAKDFEHKRLELERLEREVVALHERMEEMDMEEESNGKRPRPAAASR